MNTNRTLWILIILATLSNIAQTYQLDKLNARVTTLEKKWYKDNAKENGML